MMSRNVESFSGGKINHTNSTSNRSTKQIPPRLPTTSPTLMFYTAKGRVPKVRELLSRDIEV
jgi:hypothetical protein